VTTQTHTSDRSLYNSNSFTEAFPLSTRQVLLVRANSQYQDEQCPECGQPVERVDVNQDNTFCIRHESDVLGRRDYCTVVPDSSDFAWPDSGRVRRGSGSETKSTESEVSDDE